MLQPHVARRLEGDAVGDLLADELEALAAGGGDLVGIDDDVLDGQRLEVQLPPAVRVALLGARRRSAACCGALGVLVGGGVCRPATCCRDLGHRGEHLLEGELQLVLRYPLGRVRPDALVLGPVALEVGALQLDEVHRLGQLGAQAVVLGG